MLTARMRAGGGPGAGSAGAPAGAAPDGQQGAARRQAAVRGGLGFLT